MYIRSTEYGVEYLEVLTYWKIQATIRGDSTVLTESLADERLGRSDHLCTNKYSEERNTDVLIECTPSVLAKVFVGTFLCRCELWG